MFIAVRPIQDETLYVGDKVLIFDTRDLILEYVDKNSLFSVMYTKDTNYSKRSYIGGTRLLGLDGFYYYYALNAFMQTILHHSDGGKNEYIDVSGNLCIDYRCQSLIYTSGCKVWHIGEFIFNERQIFCKDRHDTSIGEFMDHFVSIYVGDEEVYNVSSDGYSLHYAFKYKDMLVLRYTADIDEPYITFVIDKNSAIQAIYTSEELIYGNGGLMAKIEITFNY